jgi:hypothetical protein
MSRRARHLIPLDLPHRREVIAACAVTIIVAHLLFAQLTLGLAIVFSLIGQASRWRSWWLVGPAAAGLAWTLAAGPAQAAAGFAAGAAHVVGYLGQGPLAQRLGDPLAAFADASRWLPRELPLALVAAAAEAALVDWLSWLQTDETAVAPRRPGALAALRAALAAALIRSGSVVTREGCALGVAPATGAVVDLRWREIAGGALVIGAAAQEVTVTSLQVVHAALRRRKPLIVVDPLADAAIAAALSAACAATGTRLRAALADNLGQVVQERSAALLRVGSPEAAARVCAALAALGRSLRGIGVDGDGLVWIPGCEALPTAALAPLISGGGAAGLPLLLTTTSTAAARELAGLVGVVLIHRLADPGAAADLADPTIRGSQGRALGTLGPGEFLLAVNAPRRRPAQLGRLVPARLPQAAAPPERGWRRLRYDVA